MASTLAFALLLILSSVAVTNADTAAAGPASSSAASLTAILQKGGQYTMFLRLLKETQVGSQIQSQLANSYDGMTIFAPSDNAFSKLPAGTLNSLTAQEQVQLIQFHVLTRYYSTATFQTASNPIRTQASGADGPYTLNVTATGNSQQMNVSTGVDIVPVNSALYSDFPLAVYPVDSVLLPEEMFGSPAPAEAPLPGKKKKKVHKGKNGPAPTASGDVSSTAEPPTAAEADTTTPTTKSAAAHSKVAGGLLSAAMLAVASVVLA